MALIPTKRCYFLPNSHKWGRSLRATMSMLRETRKIIREETYCFCFVDINGDSKEAPLWFFGINPKTLNHGFVSLLFFFFLLNGYTCGICRFPGLGLNLSFNWALCYSCGNMGYFSPMHWAGVQTYTSAEAQATAVRFLTYCSTVRTPVSLLFNTQSSIATMKITNWKLHKSFSWDIRSFISEQC